MTACASEMTDLEISISSLKTYYGLLNNSENRQKLKILNAIFLSYDDICNSHSCHSRLESELNFDTIHQLIEESKISDSCHETVGNILHLFLKHSLFEEYLDIYLVPFVSRCVFKMESANLSEEIRAQGIQLLRLYFNKRSFDVLKSHQEMIVNILIQSFHDTYSEVIKETCGCFIDLEFNFIKVLLDKFSNEFLIHVSKILIHQQYKVRISCINALNRIAFNADLKFIQSIFPHLAQCFLDQVPQVRLCITQVLGNWMVKLPLRHSIWDRLLSLFFASLSDEIPEIQCLALKLWHEAGKQYQNDLDKSFDEELLNESLLSCPYIKFEFQNLPLGCQELARINFGKLLSAIKNDFGDWMDIVKFKASQVLYNLIINARKGITPHTVQLFDALIVGCKISDAATLNNVMESIKLTGYFIDSSIWCPIIVKWIEDNPTLENVRILEYLLRGGQRIDELSESSIISLLAELIVFDNNVFFKETVMFCADLLMSLINWSSKESFKYFFIFATIYGTEKALKEQIDYYLVKQSESFNIKPKECIWNFFGKELIKKLESLSPCNMWTADSVEWKIFVSFIGEIDCILYLDEIKRILQIITMSENNFVMKFYCLKLVTNLFESKDDIKLIPQPFFIFCLKIIIVPNLMWHPGCTASSVRAAASTALYILIKKYRLETMGEILLHETLYRLLNLCEDDGILTRELTCRTLNCLIEFYAGFINSDQYLKVIDVMLDRMEDKEEIIRVLSCKCIGKCFNKWHSVENAGLQSICFENTVKKLLIYLHDENPKLQLAAFDVLKWLSNYDNKLMGKLVDEFKKSSTNKSIDEFVSEFKKLQC